MSCIGFTIGLIKKKMVIRRGDLRDLADLARHRAQNLNLQQLGAVACAGCAVDAREGARTAIEPRRVGVARAWIASKIGREETDFCTCVIIVSCPTACMYIYGIYLACCSSIYVICARCDVRTYHFKVQNMLIGNGRRVTFFRYCADVTYLPDH